MLIFTVLNPFTESGSLSFSVDFSFFTEYYKENFLCSYVSVVPDDMKRKYQELHHVFEKQILLLDEK